MSLNDTFDKDPPVDPKNPKKPTPNEGPKQTESIIIDVRGLENKPPQELTAIEKALLDSTKKQDDMEKKLAKLSKEKDETEKAGLLEKIAATGMKTDALKDRPLEVVKAVAETLEASGKDIVVTAKKEPEAQGKNITVYNPVTKKHEPWHGLLSGRPEKKD